MGSFRKVTYQSERGRGSNAPTHLTVREHIVNLGSSALNLLLLKQEIWKLTPKEIQWHEGRLYSWIACDISKDNGFAGVYYLLKEVSPTVKTLGLKHRAVVCRDNSLLVATGCFDGTRERQWTRANLDVRVIAGKLTSSRVKRTH